MMLTVSSAAAPLRSTQNTCAPSRAKVTAVALPLPQPGPIEPAPTTTAVLPFSRFIAFSTLLSLARAHGRDVDADRMAENFRQRPAFAARAQPPCPGGAGIAERHLAHGRARGLPAKPPLHKSRLRRRLHAGARSLDAGFGEFEAGRRDAPILLPFDLLDRMGPRQREGGDGKHLHGAGGGQAQAQAGATVLRERCRHCQSTTRAARVKPTVWLYWKSPSRQSDAIRATTCSTQVSRANRKPIATTPNRPIATSALKVASATAP